jgi:hypothetical protein
MLMQMHTKPVWKHDIVIEVNSFQKKAATIFPPNPRIFKSDSERLFSRVETYLPLRTLLFLL